MYIFRTNCVNINMHSKIVVFTVNFGTSLTTCDTKRCRINQIKVNCEANEKQNQMKFQF